MTDPDRATEEPLAQKAAGPPEGEDEQPTLVEADLLVEEISIDGMCGVY